MRLTTAGNAMMILEDARGVLLISDPWFADSGPAYFGSWTLSHEIPEDVMRSACSARFVWISHGHPDHLHPSSISRLREKTFLVGSHVGSRLRDFLVSEGLRVVELPDRHWCWISDDVRIMCITTSYQDSVLLVAVGQSLLINLNDSGARHCAKFIRSIAESFHSRYLLALSGYGDADMINIVNDLGQRIAPRQDRRVGDQLTRIADLVGATHVIPFSSFHRYQRSDSVWANEFTTPLGAYSEGVRADLSYLGPFVEVDLEDGAVTRLQPRENNTSAIPAEVFGDDWDEKLSKPEARVVKEYFSRVERVTSSIGFIEVTVGGSTLRIEMDGKPTRGVRFEAPRRSLMDAVIYEVFDDLLIGNFMRTQLFGMHDLYQFEITPAVTKYADNGRAHSLDEVSTYLNEYKRRAGLEFVRQNLVEKFSRSVRYRLPQSGPIYRAGRRAYYNLR